MRMLSQQEITEEVLKLLDQAIPRFFEEFEKMISFDSRKHTMVKKMTLPMHLLLHMTEYIRQTGPLERHCAFSMEKTFNIVTSLTAVCEEPTIAKSDKLGLNLLARIGDIKTKRDTVRETISNERKDVLMVSEVATGDKITVQKYVQENLGITDYDYDPRIPIS